ncbi:MAG: MBG domain-containing protein, partial [Bacteroidales bacterium]|nr:MBG domain-containing protein [Bacteroidales bacterium]
INESTSVDTTAIACGSYTWYGTEYTASGDYEKAFTTLAGCDSIVTLHLTINESVTSDTTAVECDAYTWYGTEYTASGDYEKTFTTVTGCDSIVTLHLTINESITVDTTAVSCDSYTWYGTEYTASGDYEKTFTTLAGCDSIVTLHLFIAPSYREDTTAIANKSFIWYGETYDASGDYTKEFKTQYGCDSIVTLHLTIRPTLHVTVVGNKDTKTYCGSSLSVSGYSVMAEGEAIGLYDETKIHYIGDSVAAGLKAGTYAMNLVVDDFSYDDDALDVDFIIEDGSLTIDKILEPIEITAESNSKIYDGTPLTDDRYSYTTESIIDGDVLVAKTEGTITHVGIADNYIVEYKMMRGEEDVTDCYNYSLVKGTLEITQRNLTLTSPTDSKAYDKTPLVNDQIVADGFAEGDGATYYVTGSQTEVGSSANTFSYIFNEGVLEEDYKVTVVEGTLTVTYPDPVVVKIVGDSASYIYDGKEKTVQGFQVEIVNSTSYTIEDFDFSPDTSISAVDAGVYHMNLTSAVAVNKNPNYLSVIFNVVDGKLTISPVATPIDIKSNSVEKMYDGMPLEDSGYTYTQGVLLDGDSLVVDVQGSITNAGFVVNEIVSYKVINEEREVTQNYTFGKITEGQLVVLKRNLNFTSASDKKVYDGFALENDNVTISGDGFAPNEGVTFEVTGSQTEIGSSVNFFTYQFNDNTLADNYNVIVKEGRLLVFSNTSVNVTITEHADTFVYDGTVHVVKGYDFYSSVDFYTEEDFRFVGRNELEVTNAGEYTMNLKKEDFVNVNYNFTDVEFEIIHNTTLVKPLKGVNVTIVGHTDTFMYNGMEQYVGGYDVITNNVLYTKEDISYAGVDTVRGTDAGTYEMNLQERNFANINPNFEDVTFEVFSNDLVILPLQNVVVVITEHSDTLIYNGKTQQVSGYDFACNSDLYKESFIQFNGDSVARGLNVGSYSMSLTENDFKNISENFTDVRFVVVKGTFMITPIEYIVVNIKEHGGTHTYTGENQQVVGYDIESTSSLYKKGDYKFSGVDTVNGINVGDYEMQLRASDFENISGNFANVKFVIVDDTLHIVPIEDVVVTITEHSDTFVYNGEMRYAAGYDFVANTPYYHEYDFDFIGVDTVYGQEAGHYGMGLKETDFVNRNRNFTNVTFDIVHDTLVIKPLDGVEVIITEHGDTVLYDGKEHIAWGYVFHSNDKLYVPENATLTTSDSVSGINAGSYSMNLSADDFKNNNPNFTNVKFTIRHHYLVIVPIENVNVTIKEHADTFIYNGSVQSVSGYDIIPDNPLFVSDNLTFKGDSVVSAISAGKYTMDLSPSDFLPATNNFKNIHFSVEHDTMVVLPKKGVVVHVTEHADTFFYDGEEKMVGGYDLDIEDPLYTESDILFTGVDTVRGTAVGKYGMGLQPSDFENINPDFDSVQFVITHDSMVIDPMVEVTVMLSMKGDTLVYNGQEQFVSGYKIVSISNPILKADEIIYTGEAEDTIVRRKDVGKSEMPINVELFKSTNPNITDIRFLLVHKPLVILPKPGVVVTITENSDVVMYDGQTHTVSGYTVQTNDELYSEKDFKFTGSATISSKDVGSYSMNLITSDFVNKNNNFKDVTFVIERGSLTVTPLEGVVVTITGKKDTVEYNGMMHSIKGSYRTCDNPLYDVYEDVNVLSSNKQATGIQSGIYYMGLQPSDYENINPNFKDVKFVVEDGSLQIDKVKQPIIITANSSYKLYDGKPLKNDGFTYTSERLDQIGDRIKAVIEGEITNVGTINNEIVSYKIINRNGENVTNNYEKIILNDGWLQINPRTITLTSASAEKEYDGKPLVCDSVIVSGEGLAELDRIIFHVDGEQFNVGESSNTFTYELVGSPFLLNNYNINVVEGTLRVTPNSTPIDIAAASDKKYYDKLPLENPTYTFTEDVLAEGDTLYVVVSGSITEVGVTDNVITEYYILRDGVDVTDNYTIGKIINGVLEVLYSERLYTIYGGKGEIVFQDVKAPVRVFDTWGRVLYPEISPSCPEFNPGEYYSMSVAKQGVYYVRVLGETVKVVVK